VIAPDDRRALLLVRLTILFAMAVAGCDGSARHDAGAFDSGARDAGTSDAGSPDAGARDAGAEDAGPIDDGGTPDAPSADAGATEPAALPPWLSYCDDGSCSTTPAIVYACPADDPACTPSRHTTVVPSVDGRPISAVFFPVVHSAGVSLRLVSGNASVLAHLVTAYAPTIEVHSDLDITLSYYGVVPVWGGTTALDFVSSTRTSSVLDSVFYAHPSYDTGTAAADLHTSGQDAIADERAITGVTSEHVRAFFMPSELAGVNGEGNWSYGDGRVTSNYGNPAYIEAVGGIMVTAFPRFAHECAHELFDEVAASFPGNASCLNEGIADALAFVAGHLPEADFGPIGLRGGDFDDGCSTQGEIHDIGNCYFWHVHRAGMLDAAFMNGIFHPQYAIAFDSCSQNLEHTGNAILVLFTDAAGGADMIPVLDAMGIPHAASYDEAKLALGL
jgi:hypothetical protein